MKRYPWSADALLAALIAPQGCSLAYVRDYEHGGNQVTEFGLLGIPDPEKEGPGGLLPLLACLFPNLGTDEEGNTATNPLRPNQPCFFPGREVSHPVGPLPQGVKSQEETVYLVTSATGRPDLLQACEELADAIRNRRSAEANQILKTFGREMAHPEPGTRVTAIRFLHVGNGSRAIPHPAERENGNIQQ